MNEAERTPQGASGTTRPADPAERPRPGVGVTIARNSLWLTIDSLAGMAASFYCSITVARSLGPELMGQYNYVLYFATVLRMFTEVSIPATVRKFAAEFIGRGDYSTLKTLVGRALRVQARLAAVGLAIGLAVSLAAFPGGQRVVATLAVLSIVPGLLLGIPTGALWATDKLRHNLVSSLAATAANVVGVTVSLVAGWGLVGLTASLLLSRLLDCVLRFALFRREFARLPGQAAPGRLEPLLRERMVRFATRQMVLAFLYSMLFDRWEVFLLRGLAPSSEIAFFSISMTLVYYLLMIPQNLAGSASVTVWVQQGRSPEEAARTTAIATWFITLIAAPVLFGVAAIGDPLLRLLYGARYLPAIPVLTVLSLASLSLAVSQPAQYLLVGAERQRLYIAWLGLGAIVDLAACLLLIPRHGALGAALAKGMGELVAGAGCLAYLALQLRARLPLRRMGRLLLACAAMFACVRLVGRPLPPLAALLVGIPLGVATFVLLARALRCLDAADRDRLRGLDRLMPSRARIGYRSVVDFLVPA
jgi:O-antigen/teichoic acid export membrane protein